MFLKISERSKYLGWKCLTDLPHGLQSTCPHSYLVTGFQHIVFTSIRGRVHEKNIVNYRLWLIPWRNKCVANLRRFVLRLKEREGKPERAINQQVVTDYTPVFTVISAIKNIFVIQTAQPRKYKEGDSDHSGSQNLPQQFLSFCKKSNIHV